MAQLHLEIVTPEKSAYSEMVDHVVLPGTEGELDVLPQHVPFMLMIKPGELKVSKGREILELAVGEGFVEITGTSVTVLTDVALTVEQIDESKVEEALERAREALKAKGTAEEEAAALAGIIEKSVAQLALKRRRR